MDFYFRQKNKYDRTFASSYCHLINIKNIMNENKIKNKSRIKIRTFISLPTKFFH